MQASDITIHSSPWARPSANVSGSGLPAAKAHTQQREVDARVRQTTSTSAARTSAARRGATGASPRARSLRQPGGHARQRLAGLGRPALDLARPPRERVVLVVGHDLRRRPRPATPGRRTSRAGAAGAAAPRPARARAPPTTPRCSSRTSVSAGLSPRSTAPPAPSAQRPAHEETHGARRPASQRPSAARVTHSAATLSDASPATRRSAQRSGCSSKRDRAVPRVEADQPRGEPVVARRAALLAARGSRRRPRRRATAAARSCSSRQRALIRSMLHGPRARISGAGLLCSLVALDTPPGLLNGAAPPAATTARACLGHVRADDAPARVDSRGDRHVGASTGAGASRTSSPTPGRAARVPPTLGAQLGHRARMASRSPCALERVTLAAPRVQPPPSLSEICTTDAHERASHALGKSYVDVVRGFRGRFDHPPDFVARPRDERDVERVLEWCSSERVAAIPYGGGTSVCRRRRRPTSARATTAPSRSTCARSTACSRSTRCRAPRASRRARSGRASRPSSASTA